jgi:hypothetical protein
MAKGASKQNHSCITAQQAGLLRLARVLYPSSSALVCGRPACLLLTTRLMFEVHGQSAGVTFANCARNRSQSKGVPW